MEYIYDRLHEHLFDSLQLIVVLKIKYIEYISVLKY